MTSKKEERVISHLATDDLKSRLDLPIEEWDRIPEDLDFKQWLIQLGLIKKDPKEEV